ncbi:MAG: sigma 54-interacting transcriptional regulator [Myxococcales bacterium]|nr:sigma 54-interacting transcriptional regulator [Myxococcales bacterium]
MASIIVAESGQSRPRTIPLFKKVTTFGSEDENDVVLGGTGIDDYHAQVVFDGRDFIISVSGWTKSVTINGKKRRTHVLEDGDEIGIGDCRIRFSLYDEKPAVQADPSVGLQVDVLRRLVSFSERLMGTTEIQQLLVDLLDQVVETTNADKGFIILVRDDGFSVRVARDSDKNSLKDADLAMSDSIVEKVIRTREPVIVSDALKDDEFSMSQSVVNLKLCSVMCVPLIARGELLGVIYVGNDNVVNLFTVAKLEVLKVYAGQAALIIRNALLVNELQLDNQRLKAEIDSRNFGDIIGSSDSMRDIFRKIDKIATTDISVLVQGETGTGKELIAKEIHARSGRKAGPFVVINCGAIPENLLESELFGHTRGAFTGAVATVLGKFQVADKGTLFLDEIGELPLNLQVKLLRAIQERQVTKVGDTRPEKVDIRIVAATNRVLQDEVKAGRFREDLYYRLNVITLTLPPLCERGDDVILIARYLLKKYSGEFGGKARDFTREGIRAIRKHRWPGNIRELENRIKKAVVFADGPLVGPAELDLDVGLVQHVLSLADAKEEFQREYIEKVLRMNDGNRTKTARDLGVDPRTIFRHLERERDGEGGPEGDEV